MKIVEVKNDKLQIQAFKMANDAIIKNVEVISNNYGFFQIIVGKPNSGKSCFWLSLITKKSKYNYFKKFHKIYIFSNSLKTITTKIDLPEDQMYDGIDQLEEVVEKIRDSDDRVLIILDDVVTDLKASDDFLLKLIYNRRHIGKSISIIITSQVYNKIPLQIRKCANDLVLFSTQNKKELESVFAEYINIPKKNFDQIIQYCFQTNHDFLLYKTSDNSYYRNFNPLEINFD